MGTIGRYAARIGMVSALSTVFFAANLLGAALSPFATADAASAAPKSVVSASASVRTVGPTGCAFTRLTVKVKLPKKSKADLLMVVLHDGRSYPVETTKRIKPGTRSVTVVRCLNSYSYKPASRVEVYAYGKNYYLGMVATIVRVADPEDC